jgi:hypothetical protein
MRTAGQTCLLALLALAAGAPAVAGEADVVDAELRRQADGSYTAEVTLRHDDAGWDHYADRWEVLSPEGAVLATRTLHHPHVEEQPFTRSLSGIDIPETLSRVRLRAHDSVHGYGGIEIEMQVPR